MAQIGRKKLSEITRADVDFIKEMKELAKYRYLKNLEKREPTSAEMTRLLRRTQAWKQAQQELRLKKRSENL